VPPFASSVPAPIVTSPSEPAPSLPSAAAPSSRARSSPSRSFCVRWSAVGGRSSALVIRVIIDDRRTAPCHAPTRAPLAIRKHSTIAHLFGASAGPAVSGRLSRCSPPRAADAHHARGPGGQRPGRGRGAGPVCAGGLAARAVRWQPAVIARQACNSVPASRRARSADPPIVCTLHWSFCRFAAGR
jgi:hypothetical protein